MNKEDKDFYLNCLLGNNRLQATEIFTQGSLLMELSKNYNLMVSQVDWLTKMVRTQQERINQLEARLFVKDHAYR